MNDSQDLFLSRLGELVALYTGLDFSSERLPDLKRGIKYASKEFGFEDSQECIQWLLSSRLTDRQIKVLTNYLTIGETYFFRDKGSIEALEQKIFPELIKERSQSEKRLNIWSAGCSTGEEPYSIAILLKQSIPDLKNWKITILATDINELSIEKASAGIYNEWSFRCTPHWLKQKYFAQSRDGRFAIADEIKRMVKFSRLNLAEDEYTFVQNHSCSLDLILCRNVLMYLTPASTEKIIQNFYQLLADRRWLLVSPVEISRLQDSQFVTINFPDTILHRKDLQAEKTTNKLWPADFCSIPEDSIDPSSLSSDEDYLASNETYPLAEDSTSALDEFLDTVDHNQCRYDEAFALSEQGRYKEAAEKVSELLPQDLAGSEKLHPKVMLLLAQSYANQGRLDAAQTWCETVISADKLEQGGHYLLATILQEKGLIEEAIASLKRALYLDPNHVLAHFAMSGLARRQGKIKESNKYLENTISLLTSLEQEEVLPGSDGMTAGRLLQISRSMLGSKISH
jgi:chemotaxis protein methyltransferase CheR